jgi:hypothetical protein
MKRRTWQLSLLILFAVIFNLSGNTQTKDTDYKQLITSKNFVFRAQSALSQTGKDWPLTPQYDLTISGDSVIAWLPYFGRVYSAPYGETDGGIKFSSASSAFSLTEKKGKFEVAIKPKDLRESLQLYLSIFDNGRASLLITSSNRQSISFDGYIVEGNKKEKKAF